MYAVHITEQEIRQAKLPSTRVNSIRLQFALWGSQIEEVVGPPDVLIPKFEAMTALQPAQIFNDVPSL